MTKVKVRMGDDEAINIEVDGSTGVDMIKQLGLTTSSVLLLANGSPVPDDDELDGDTEYTVIVVMSGG